MIGEEMDIYKMLVYRDKEGILQYIETAVEQGKISKELLSLAYAVFGKTSQAQDVIVPDEENTENLFVLEMKMLVEISRRNLNEATMLANRILEKYPNAAFARYFLAYIAIRERKFQAALDHYQAFLRHYPNHDTVILRTSEVLAYLKRYQEAINYARQCKSSLEGKVYMLLIPAVLPRYRLMLLLLVVLVDALNLQIPVLLVVLIAIFIGILISLRKSKGTLIANRLFFLGVMVVLYWLLGRWISWVLQR